LSDWKRAEEIEEIQTTLFSTISKPQSPPKKNSSYNYGLFITGLMLLFVGIVLGVMKFAPQNTTPDANDVFQKESIDIQQIKDLTLY